MSVKLVDISLVDVMTDLDQARNVRDGPARKEKYENPDISSSLDMRDSPKWTGAPQGDEEADRLKRYTSRSHQVL